jgi:hypothetical protein
MLRWTDFTGLKLALTRAARPPRPLKTYEVKIENGNILVRVPGETGSA